MRPTPPDLPTSLHADWPVPDHVKLVSTTRTGGYSQSPYDSFNLALHTNDDSSCVNKNRLRLREHFQLPAEPLWLNQVHGKQVVSLDNILPETISINADASWTSEVDTVCAVLTADCLPVFFSDVNGTVVAIAHAGWKGLLAGVITETAKALAVDCGDIVVWLGPAISAKAFIVGDDVRQAFWVKSKNNMAAFSVQRDGFWFCDLYRLARLELNALGIENIYGGNYCTYTEERFYSYRQDGENSGRLAHCIWMDPH